MSNHGYVKTKEFMSAKKILTLLHNLNQKHFKGNLQIEMFEPPKINQLAWWELIYTGDDGKQYGYRQCWLNTQKSFEIRHGGGGDFVWWIDCVISNEVAAQFNGIITDDGCEDKIKGELPYKYASLNEFVNMMWNHVPKWYRSLFMRIMRKNFPPEFRSQKSHRKNSGNHDLKNFAK